MKGIYEYNTAPVMPVPAVPELVPATGTPMLLGTRRQHLNGIFGPPGTGKTLTLRDKVCGELARGVQPDQIAFIAFTAVAAKMGLQSVVEKTGLSFKELPHFRTLHSLCWRIMGQPGKVLSSDHIREFAAKNGYRMSGTLATSTYDVLAQSTQGRAVDDQLHQVFEWSRARRLPLEEGQSRCPQRVPLSRLQRFVDDLRRFKEDNILFDYTDMLEFVVTAESELEVDVAVIDEAQDLSPLQITVVELLFRNCERVHIAGDDDQAIFAWAGADPTWMLSLKERSTEFEVLPQSYRVPPQVQAVAERIIRNNRNRVVKTYAPRAGSTGKVSRMTQTQAINYLCQYKGKSFVLARNAFHLRPWMSELMKRGVPYMLEGPTGELIAKSYDAVQTAILLTNDMPVDLEALKSMFDFVPCRGDTLLPRGAKAKLDRMAAKTDVPTLSRDILAEIGFEKFLAHLDSVGPVAALSKLSGKHRSQLMQMTRRYGAHLPKPKVTLSTIHRSKGDERDTVVIVPDMSRASFEELTQKGQEGREAETRVAYVAVTRAREHLIIVEPRGRKYFPYERYLRGTGLKEVEI